MSEKHRMPVGSTMLPGRPGTKKLMAKCGDSLVFVRYRYDKNARKRYTTVEIVESEAAWDPDASTGARKLPERQPRDRIGVRVGFHETELREKVKQIGGLWRPRQRLWELTYAQACALGLQARIVGE